MIFLKVRIDRCCVSNYFFLFQPEHKSLQVEHMEYESTQFFSDIGGAAGLILGVSLNAFFGIGGATKAFIIGYKCKNNHLFRKSDGLVIWKNENEMDATIRI